MNALDVIAGSQLDQSLAEVDPEVAAAVAAELHRQQSTLEMIASENFAPVAVMEAQGSVLTNKYAEGYPGRRYYGGCEHVDVIEQLAIDRVKALFGAEFANVQPHSGAQANAAAMLRAAAARATRSSASPWPTAATSPTACGSTSPASSTTSCRTRCARTTTWSTWTRSSALAPEHRPKMIIAGWSAYPRQLDFARVPARSPTRSAPT